MAGHTAIITACAHEAALVRRRLRSQGQAAGTAGRVWQGVLHNQRVVLLQCGMGPERATQAVLWLSQHYQLTGVLSVGFAGGFGCFGFGAAGQRLLCDTPAMVSCDADVVLRPDARLAHIAAMAVAQAAIVSHTGTLLSTTAVVAQAAAKQDIGRRSGALAVDMESYSVGHVATQNHIPFAVLRTIFDTANETFSLPVTTCTTATGSVRPLRLFGCLACQPWLLAQLPHWGWAAHVARRHLQRWLQHFFLLLSQGA